MLFRMTELQIMCWKVNITATNKHTLMCGNNTVLVQPYKTQMAVTMHAIKSYTLFEEFHLHNHSFAGLVSTWLRISVVQYKVLYICVCIYIYIKLEHVYKHNMSHTNTIIVLLTILMYSNYYCYTVNLKKKYTTSYNINSDRICIHPDLVFTC